MSSITLVFNVTSKPQSDDSAKLQNSSIIKLHTLNRKKEVSVVFIPSGVLVGRSHSVQETVVQFWRHIRDTWRFGGRGAFQITSLESDSAGDTEPVFLKALQVILTGICAREPLTESYFVQHM